MFFYNPGILKRRIHYMVVGNIFKQVLRAHILPLTNVAFNKSGSKSVFLFSCNVCLTVSYADLIIALAHHANGVWSVIWAALRIRKSQITQARDNPNLKQRGFVVWKIGRFLAKFTTQHSPIRAGEYLTHTQANLKSKAALFERHKLGLADDQMVENLNIQ